MLDFNLGSLEPLTPKLREKARKSPIAFRSPADAWMWEAGTCFAGPCTFFITWMYGRCVVLPEHTCGTTNGKPVRLTMIALGV